MIRAGEAKMLGIKDLPITDIDLGDRVRPVSESALASLIVSIKEIGHMADEIHVRKMKGDRFELIAGGHRVAAANELGWETIRAKVWQCSATWARLWQLDDNLAHAELDALELATFLAERKAVHLKLYPEMKQGGFRGNQHTGNLVPDIMSMTTTIAEKRGISERHVRRLLQAGEALTRDEIRWLREADTRPTLIDLQALAKEGDAHIRSQAVISFTNGDAKTIKKAIAAQRPTATIKDPVEKSHIGLLSAFRRAPKEAKRRFVRDTAQDLQALLDDLPAEDTK